MPGIPYPTTTNTFQAVGYDPGTNANDRIYTDNVTNTQIWGGLGDDYATLTGWNIYFHGDAGNDVIEARNALTLEGGAGSDYYLFDIAFYFNAAYTLSSSYIWATIVDFENGFDKIAILNGTGGVTSFSGLSLAQVGANVEITIGASVPRLVLQNTLLSAIDASDFIFGDGTGGGAGGGSTITGTASSETLTGTNADETIIGLGGNDILNGAGGNDVFKIGGTADGFDSIDGGTGSDQIQATSSGTIIGLNAISNVESISSNGFSNITISGSSGANVLNFSTVSLTGISAIKGGAGDDVITGSGAADTLMGEGGNDTLNGNTGDDILDGGGGNNILDGGVGIDTARYSGLRSNYSVVQNSNGTYGLTGGGVVDTLANIENASFSDGSFALSSLVSQPSGTAHVNSITGLRAALADTNVSMILIAPGTYALSDYDPNGGYGNAGFAVTHNVTIKVDAPVGVRANFDAANFDFAKGIFFVRDGVSATFDGIGFYNTRVNGLNFEHNEAGIRHEGIDLTVRNSYFTNDYNGILASSLPGRPGGRLVVENSSFVDNGDPGDYPGNFVPGQEHHIYWQGKSASISGSTFNNSGYGHAIKLVVSEYGNVINNIIDDAGGPANSAVNSTGGGSLTITGNSITKSATAENPYIVYYETIRGDGMGGAITLSNNIINSGYSGTILLGNLSDAVANVSGNTITGASASVFDPTSTIFSQAIMSGNTLNGSAFNSGDFLGRATQGSAAADIKVFDGIDVFYTPNILYNGGAGDDIILSGSRLSSPDVLIGGIGNDTISGGPGADFLYGGDGNDVLFSGIASGVQDHIFGGAGDDKIYMTPRSFTSSSQSSYIDGGAGNDLIDGRYSDDMVATGGAGDDVLLGSNNPNVSYNWLNGGDGSDILFGAAGQDNIISGGSQTDVGTDTAVYLGAYGVDLTVTPDIYEPSYKKWVFALNSVGSTEVGNGEAMDNIEYVQFSNGSYNIATGVFTSGLVRVNIGQYLNAAVPNDPAIPSLPYDLLKVDVGVSSSGGSVSGTSGADTAVDQGLTSMALGAGNDIYVLNSYYGSGVNVVVNEAANAGIDTVAFRPFGGASIALATNVEIGVIFQTLANDGRPTLTGNALDNLLADMDDLNPYTSETTQISTLDGAGGNDVLYGGNGNDNLIGGTGVDTVIMRGTRSQYTISGSSIVHNTPVSKDDGTDTLTGIEFIQFADGTLNLATNEFSTYTNNTTSISYLGGAFSLLNFQFVGPLNLTGTATADMLTGDAGDDTLSGLAGNDTLLGNDGNDILTGGAGNDLIDGGSGVDAVSYTANSVAQSINLTLTTAQTISAGDIDTIVNVENVIGGSGADTITGSSLANVLNGGAGLDIINGGDGTDVLSGGTGNDTLNGGLGIDTVDYSYSTANLTLNLSLTSAQTVSTGDADTISNVENATGGSGADSITGTSTANVLNGAAGNDRLKGGVGNDTIIGGVGTSDVAVFAGLQASYTIATNAGVVSVTDNQPTTDGNDGVDTVSGIEKVEFKGGVQVGISSPIVLDLNGDGVSLINRAQSTTSFDWDGDGKLNKTGWVGKDDGFLVYDRNHDGKVSDSRELSFVDDKPGAKSDLDGLSAFDTNHDGVFSNADDAFGNFRVWRDANSNGRSDRGEFMSLADAGVASITLAGEAVNKTWGWTDNLTINTGTFTRTDGSTAALGDVALNYATQQPNVRSFGRGGRQHRFAETARAANQLAEAIAAFTGNDGGDTLMVHDMMDRKDAVFAVAGRRAF